MKTCSANKCSYPVFSHGYCKAHQYMRKDEKYDRRTPIQKYYDNLKKNGCVNENGGLIVSKTEELISQKEQLEMWFMRIKMKHFTIHGGHCMECGEFIPIEYARHATAHLLPKKLFKSVCTHDLNYLILGAGCGCHDKTHRIDKFVTMKIWPIAATRIKEMIPLLPFDELKYLSSQLMVELEKTN